MEPTPTPEPVERLTYTTAEAAQAIGVSPNTMRMLVSTGTVRCVRAGDRVIIPREAVTEYLSGSAASPPSRPGQTRRQRRAPSPA